MGKAHKVSPVSARATNNNAIRKRQRSEYLATEWMNNEAIPIQRNKWTNQCEWDPQAKANIE